MANDVRAIPGTGQRVLGAVPGVRGFDSPARCSSDEETDRMTEAEKAAEAWREANNNSEMGLKPYTTMKTAFLAGAAWQREQLTEVRDVLKNIVKFIGTPERRNNPSAGIDAARAAAYAINLLGADSPDTSIPRGSVKCADCDGAGIKPYDDGTRTCTVCHGEGRA